ncbi:MAG: GAF domain-containing protein [Deltaproteobacteria bacterium]|jgi:two-component system, NtrC family, sensor histidine kinase HydH
MAFERAAFLTQMVEVLTSTVSFGERLNNMVHLLARHLKADLALYFGLDKARETLLLNVSSQGPVPPHMRLEFPLGQGLVGETASTRQASIIHRVDPGVVAANVPLEKLHPAYQTLAAFPVADDNFLYGVLILIDKSDRSFTTGERQGIHLTCLMLAAALRQAIVQEEAKKRIAELSVLFDVGRALSTTVELDEILERIVSTTAKVITARGAALQIIDTATGEPRVSSRYGRIPAECPTLSKMRPSTDSANPPFFEGEAKDDAGHTHYCLAVPLTFKGQLTGTLGVYDKFNPNGEYLPFDPENRQLLFTMAGVIVNAIENALTYQQVEDLAERNERMVRNLTALQEISQIMLTSVQEERLLEIILQGLTLQRGLGFDRTVLLMVDETNQTLKGVKGALRSSFPSEISNLKALLLPPQNPIPVDDWEIPLRVDQGPLALAVLRKVPYHHHETNAGSGLPPTLEGKYTAQEFFAVPLLVKGRATGVILVDNQASGRPLESEPLHVLQMFATQAALVLENAHLYSTIETNNRELLLIRERMLESDRLAALSSLASGMAHEIRNPLVSIGGFARRIAKLVEPNSPLRGYVEVIQEEVTRLEKLLREILDFTGENLSYYGDHELVKLIEDTLILVQRDLDAEDIKVVKEFAQLPRIHCDDRQMKQVFYNLFQNAVQAMAHSGTLTIRTFPVEKPDGLYAAAAISDTGGGIPMEVLYNIFNPFFSTKDYGTGLGLAIAQRIVSRHYGQIEVNNEMGKGVTFIVTLPVAKYCLVKEVGKGAVPASALKAPKGGQS